VKELGKLDIVRELYITSYSDVAIVSRVSGKMQELLSVQDRINLSRVNNIRIIPVKSAIKKDALPLGSSSITLTCAYCDKKVTDGAVRKKLDDRDYYFCCNTCQSAFGEKYRKLLAN
ncbi:MAG: TRASH domain-containing protein, partial [Candidatus Methanoperedens sp.]|nr:TRASH domain-containing protein [Candidatus Methanoperedens sp.]